MEDLSKLTPIELQKMGNDIKEKHDKLKEELDISINEKAKKLEELEEIYVKIVEMITT